MQQLLSKRGVLLLLLGLAACNGGGTSLPATSQQAMPAAAAAPPASPVAVEDFVRSESADATISSSAQGTDVLAIDAGSSRSVGSWGGDSDYSSGLVASVSNSIKTSGVTNAAPQAVYQTQRYGVNFSYTVARLTPRGTYAVRLHFAETYWTGARRRMFNVKINGAQVLSGFDIFASAGGPNIATVKQFNTSADASGRIVIQFAGSTDNATVAGVEILTSGSATSPPATPTPAPPAGAGGDVLPWVYSELWAGSSPFRTSVAQQMSSGAHVLAHQYMDSLWSQGIAGNGTAAIIPIYVAKSSDPLVTTTCTQYGTNCNAKGVQIHLPSYATAQRASDGHITIIDENAPSGAIEIDCWQAAVYGSRFSCSWAGMYRLGSSGVSESGSEGIHGGMAVSTVYVTGQEFVNGHIDHALGMATHCLNNPSYYPADMMAGTDAGCGSSNPPNYGDMMHLLWSTSQIQSSGYSQPCKVILTAFAKYGAYLDDTGNNGLQLNVHNELSYTANPATRSQDPWPHIQSQLNAGGDGNGTSWYSCLNRLRSSDFELIRLAQP